MAEPGFFDIREKLAAPRKPRGSTVAPSNPDSTLTVSQVTKLIDTALRSGTPASVNVRGEVSNFKHNQGSGHAYFTLKDTDACINCVMFRGEFERVKFRPQDGMELLATGNVRVYAAQGKYQLYVNALQPLGKGALELAFQQLRLKLEAEGLFTADRKRELPRYPTRIVIITSRETAALADILKVLRRFPWLQLIHAHVPVQGEGSAKQIAAAVAFVNGHREAIGNPDLILLGRGGGSLGVQRRAARSRDFRVGYPGHHRHRTRGGCVYRRPGRGSSRPHPDRSGAGGNGSMARDSRAACGNAEPAQT
jgi:hypothetical protein